MNSHEPITWVQHSQMIINLALSKLPPPSSPSTDSLEEDTKKHITSSESIFSKVSKRQDLFVGT